MTGLWHRGRAARWSCPIVLPLVLLACAPLNQSQSNYDYRAGYRFGNSAHPDNSDELFVVLSFSGGGTRAAAFSYGVLEALRDIPVVVDGKRRALLDEVDVISSVSGGSFTAAYYALFGRRIFDDFKQRFLTVNVQGALALRWLCTWNWFRLASPYFSRIDMAAEYYGHLFGDLAFDRLIELGQRPYLIINATDLSLGTRFEFVQSQFDLLGSDLSQFPIARAVAASSAFPGLLSPMTMKNYPKTAFKEPQWVAGALEDLDTSPRRFVRGMDVQSYFDVEKRPFVHLVDGGVSDNLGLRGPLHSLMFPDSMISGDLEGITDSRELNLQRMIPRIRHLVFIVVDAKPAVDTSLDRSESAPWVGSVVATIASAPLTNYSFETVQLLRDYAYDREMQLESEPEAMKIHVVHLRFDAIPDPKKRDYVAGLGTNFCLPDDAVQTLIDTAGELLRGSGEFQSLVEAVGAPAPPAGQ